MAWTVSNPVSIGMATKKAHFDALWDNCDMFKTQHGTDGTHGAVTATSLASASITPSNLTASEPVFSDGSKKLISKSVADTLTALGVGSAAFQAYLTATQADVTGDGTNYSIAGAIWTEVFDTGTCFSNGTFTAPATGVYLFTGLISFYGLTADHNDLLTRLITTAGNYAIFKGNPNTEATGAGYYWSTNFSILVPLSATNTAYLQASAAGSSKDVDIYANGTQGTLFSGFRLK